jgi:hypothetical protein
MNQQQLRLRAMVQAPLKKEYPNKIYDKKLLQTGKQIENEYTFEGNWWWFWFRGELPISIGNHIFLDKNYVIEEIHIYKNYKRGTMLLS